MRTAGCYALGLMVVAVLLLVPVFVVCLWAMKATASVTVRVPEGLAEAIEVSEPAPVSLRRIGPLVCEATRIVRPGPRGDTVLVGDAQDLGVVRLVERSRQRMLFVFTRAGAVAHVGARLAGGKQPLVDEVTNGATVVPDGLLPDGAFAADRALGAVEAMALLIEVRRRAPAAIDRILCASTEGVALTVSGATLTSHDVVVDLSAPLVWRPLAFHETGGGVGGVFQGTWIEQGDKRVVFVSPLPTLSVWRDPHAESGILEALFSRDPAGDARALELAMSPAADPPPTEARVPVDALLMFPLRAALARSASATRGRAPWTKKATALRPAR